MAVVRGQVSRDRSGLEVDVMVVCNFDHSMALVACRGRSSLPLASVLVDSLPRYSTGQIVSLNISLRKVMRPAGHVGLRGGEGSLDLLVLPELAPEPDLVKSLDHRVGSAEHSCER